MAVSLEVALGLASLAFAFALVWFGRRRSAQLMQSGLVFVSYPAVVLVFIALGLGLLVTSMR